MTHKKRKGHENKRGPLELVLKADTVGTLEAALGLVRKLDPAGHKLSVIKTGVGPVSQSDLNMALTGGHLVMGLFVEAQHRVDLYAREHGVEVRLYNVIYRIGDDLEKILAVLHSAACEVPAERILGEGKVIVLFKSKRKGIILGIEVTRGALRLGERFRVIDVAGPVYEGVVESLHIEKDVVREAREGQQVGLQISDWKQAKVGDLVETFRPVRAQRLSGWSPRPGVHKIVG